MKILAFNASPRKAKGTTEILMNHFLKAAEMKGAEINKHYVTELKINGCTGCFTCWTKTPGKCIHRDDMDWIIKEYNEADVIVFGTPIYNNNIIHYQQKMTERFLPNALPWQVEEGEKTRHPSRYKRKPQKSVLIATAGFPDHQAFTIARALYPNSIHITLPAAQILTDEQGSKYVEDLIDAVHMVASLLVEGKEVDQTLQNRLNMEYTPEVKQMIREQANKHFEENIEQS